MKRNAVNLKKGILMLKDDEPVVLFPSMSQASRVINKPLWWISKRCKKDDQDITLKGWETKYEFVYADDYNAMLNESNECLEGYGIELK